tara:strand:+ start:4468 stop:5310 length:843 start_codon:yes stop_codon:yes gene_type:complete
MEDLQEFCRSNNLFGRILLGTEGINGGVSGSLEEVKKFKEFIVKNPLFANLTFREQSSGLEPYQKLVVQLRKEVVAFGEEVNLKNTAEHISPAKLKSWLDNDEDFILLDTRNEYEIKIGKFKNALGLPIDSFREFPDAVKKLTNLKDKKVVTYCTGGVRCEKASAFMKEHGFKNVFQLEGGIINFANQFPNEYFEGSCFVFDNRIASKISSVTLNTCSFCTSKTDEYINCHNLDYDKLFIACASCSKGMNGTCSVECKSAPRQRVGRGKQAKVFQDHVSA